MELLVKSLRLKVLLLLLVVLPAPLLVSQTRNGSASPNPADKSQTNEPPLASSGIRVHVDEVIAPVSVTDKKGVPVLDLSQKDFHIFDNGFEQTIDNWSFDGDPLSLVLVIETSSHMQATLPAIHKLASIFTESVVALDGEAAVVTYDSTVDVRQPFTQDHDAIEKSIIQTNLGGPEMKLYDAMAASVQLLQEQPSNRRRVMLIIGESQDSESEAKLGRVARDAVLANITIYAIGPSSTAAELRGANLVPLPTGKHSPSISTSPPGKDPLGRSYYDFMAPAFWLVRRGTNQIDNHKLETVVAATGGVHYSAFHEATLSSTLDKIGAELHSQYILSYAPSTDRPVGFNEIKVTVSRPNLTVRTRPSYYLYPIDGTHTAP